MQFQYSPEQTGLAPDVELAIALTAAEARTFQMFWRERRMRPKQRHGNAGSIDPSHDAGSDVSHVVNHSLTMSV